MTFISYAQNFEDVMLWRALKHVGTGRYVDVGAAHPDEYSVTRAFYDRGWQGINIEPTLSYFRRLKDARPRDLNLNFAVGAKAGELPFFEIEGTGLSTLDACAADRHRAAGWAVRETMVEIHTLAEIVRQHVSTDVHFLKIDVEGYEHAVLLGADFSLFRPWIVLIEATRPLSSEQTHEEFEDLLTAADYRFAWFDGLNRFYVAAEHWARLSSAFASPPNIFDDFIRACDTEQLERILGAESRASQAELRAAQAQKEAALAEVRAAQAQKEAEVRAAQAQNEAALAEVRAAQAQKETEVRAAQAQKEAEVRAAQAQNEAALAKVRAVAADRRAARAEARSVAADERVVQTEARAVAADERAVQTEARAVAADERVAQAEARAVAADEQAAQAEARAVAADGQAAQAEARAVAADEQAAQVRRDVTELSAAHLIALTGNAALRASTSWRITAPLRAIRHLFQRQVGLTLLEMGVSLSRLERLKRVGGSDGGATKRAARIAFYTISRSMARIPGAARLSAGLERLPLGPWRLLRLRYDNYLAVAARIDGHQSSKGASPEYQTLGVNRLPLSEQPAVDGPPLDLAAVFSGGVGTDAAIDMPYAVEDVIENEEQGRPEFKPQWSPILLTRAEPVRSTDDERYLEWISERETISHLLPTEITGPTISILIPVTAALASRLPTTLHSLQRQTHNHWQAIVSFVSGSELDERSDIFASIARSAQVYEGRIQLTEEASVRTGGALRSAVDAATGEFVMVLEPGDSVPPHAIAAMSQRLGRDAVIDILYADEDVMENEERRRPQFKPEWSPELLTSYNYFGRPTLIRRRLITEAGSFDPDLDSACEWDLNLRLVRDLFGAVSAAQVRHLPAVLCHRHPSSDTGRSAPDDPAAIGNRLTLTRHWERQGVKALVTTQPDGTQRTTWDIVDPPLVSVIIPNKGNAALLRGCLSGLMHKTTYPRIEIIIIDNGSTEAEVFALYREVEEAGVRIFFFDEPFNFSRACNIGAGFSMGELLLFLNNDIEIISPDWLDEMVRCTMLPGVGMTGPKLLYPDGGIQHAGVAIGLFTLCAHVFRMAPEHEWGIFGSPNVVRNWLAVTGACQLMRRTAYDRVGGYDENFTLAYGDIKLALDVWRAGYRIVYTPAATLIHYEGASRGQDTPEADQKQMAFDMRSLGIMEDPYFHPCLAALSFIPRLPINGEPATTAAIISEAYERLVGDLLPKVELDLFDDVAVTGYSNQSSRVTMWDPDWQRTIADAWSAARLMIDLLRRRRDLRARFPRALSAGPDGAFARWLKTEGVVRYGLPAEFVPAVDAAFAANFAAKARQVVLYDDALCAKEPLFLLPPGRPTLVASLFTAVAQGTLSRESAWWLLLEAAEDPGRELVHTWLFTPAWQRRFPEGITIFGRHRFSDWIRQSFGISAPWLVPSTWPLPLTAAEQIRTGYHENEQWYVRFPNALTDLKEAQGLVRFLRTTEAGISVNAKQWCAALDPETEAPVLVRRGVNILGHFSYPSGLRTSAQSIIAGLHLKEIETALRDVRVDLATDEPVHHKFSDLEFFDTTIIHVQPEPFFDVAMARSGLHERSLRTYRIGYWYWEFDRIPASWDRAAAQCDELWTATEFIAQGLRERYSLPVRVLLPGLELPNFERLPRSYFKLDEQPFLFLFTFHMTSIAERKNPWGLIAAFRRAFSDDDNALLVIKTSFGERFPEDLTKLKAAAHGARVRIINAVYTQEETLSLMACADAYVSLHRSEGLGLTIAESMLLEKPAVATGYSGNVAFMNEANSLLVDYRVVELGRAYPPYTPELCWAEPSIDHAAALMRRLYEDQDFAADLGARGAADLRHKLSYSHTGQQIADRLAEIDRLMKP